MKTKTFIYIIVLVLFGILLYSCTITVEKKKKSHNLASIKNKGVVLEKYKKYACTGAFVIKTKTDIVSEDVGNIEQQPMRTIFETVSVGDTIK